MMDGWEININLLAKVVKASESENFLTPERLIHRKKRSL